MRQRLVFAIAGALLMMVLELLALPLLWGLKALRYTLYAPAMLVGDFLVFARHEWQWPIPPSEGLGELPHWLVIYLLYFNWFCYAALGFGMGWWLGKFFQPSAKPRRRS
ncbi:hypothetical protein [Archangium violaceum]|uniref:Uncharacterized protein n=1 Tax=Archangium violaceum Cb vi76 TaxID=1406225 RepID=A0A084SRT0_9BACT|nr:hypothetical protein [Archangium violaceum]KFA91165.1 hypothetical protein Q664_23850 [Archangium violaceum Cb vi76]